MYLDYCVTVRLSGYQLHGCWEVVQNDANFGTSRLAFKEAIRGEKEEMVAKSQGAKLPMEKFREITRLYELGRNQIEIARSCKIARSTVQDYLRRAAAKSLSYEQLSQMSDHEAQGLLGKGKRKTKALYESSNEKLRID